MPFEQFNQETILELWNDEEALQRNAEESASSRALLEHYAKLYDINLSKYKF